MTITFLKFPISHSCQTTRRLSSLVCTSCLSSTFYATTTCAWWLTLDSPRESMAFSLCPLTLTVDFSLAFSPEPWACPTISRRRRPRRRRNSASEWACRWMAWFCASFAASMGNQMPNCAKRTLALWCGQCRGIRVYRTRCARSIRPRLNKEGIDLLV